VATQDIPAQARITLSAVTLASISEESVPARPFVDIGQAVGQVARQPIFKGDILTADRVLSLDQIRAGGTGAVAGIAASPSLVLDKDQVMIVLPAHMTGGFAGQSPNLLTNTNAIRDGDYVDVLATTLELPDGMTPQERGVAREERPWDYLRTRVLFQNLRVHHVGSFPDLGDNRGTPGQGGFAAVAPAGNSATRPEDRYLAFVVDRETALKLKWLKDIVALGHANVDFVLRSPVDQEIQPNETLTVQDLRRQFGMYGGRQAAP
jgi:hypothetical protein